MRHLSLALALPCLLAPVSLLADDFTGFSMDFVDIGNAGNAADDPPVGNSRGFGAVGYDYRMGKHEVSRAMIDSYNANSGGPTITMADLAANGITGGNLAGRPATGVSWNQAARFVNWLNTSQGYSAAYNFTTGGANDNVSLWTAGDAGYDASNPFRNSNAHYFLPSEDEWYKAAYYDPNANGGAGGYWNYATGSDSAPTAVTGGTASGTAVYGQPDGTTGGPALVTDAGGLSPYGTMAQGGNARELTERAWTTPLGQDMRLIRGGSWFSPGGPAASLAEQDASNGSMQGTSPTSSGRATGFRVASVPEPSGLVMTLLGAMGLVMRRKRS